METYTSYTQDNQKDYGERLFEFDDSKSIYDSPVKLKRALKSPVTYYFLAVLIFLLVWIIYSIVKGAGAGRSVVSYIDTLFVFVILAVFTVVTVFGLWGKLLRFASHKSQNSELNARTLPNARKKHRTVVAVYKDYIEIVKRDVSVFFEKSQVEKIVVLRDRNYFSLVLYLDSGRPTPIGITIPNELLGNFARACSGVSIEVKKALGYDTGVKLDKSVGTLIGGTLFLLLPIVVGAVLIWLHYNVNAQVPSLLGIFFILGGIVAICAFYSFIPFLKHVMVPMLFGLLFTIAPMLLAAAVFQSKGLSFDAQTYLASLDAMLLGFTYISALGLFITLIAIRSMIDYFVYVVKK